MQSGTSEGRGPHAGVCQSANGLLYGTVYYGGSSSVGAIFKVDTAGNYNLVRSFQTTGGDGQNPNSELVEQRRLSLRRDLRGRLRRRRLAFQNKE